MKPDDEEHELRKAFAALREDDRRHTPELERLLSRPITRRQTAPVPWKPILAGAAVAAAVTLMIAVLRWQSSPFGVEDNTTAVALAAWRAPTDVLLETPGRSLLAEVPAFGGGGFLPPPAHGRPKNGAPGSLSGRKENTP